MAAVKRQHELTPEVTQRVREVLKYLRVRHISLHVWNDVLTEDERQRLGESYPLTELTVGFSRLRGYTHPRAILDLALEASVIGAGMHVRLRRQIGEPVAAELLKPRWDATVGRLYFRGAVIRKVSARGTDIRKILEAFEIEHWKTRIDDPLPGGPNSKKLREAIASLNCELSGVKFYADGKAEGIFWQEL